VVSCADPVCTKERTTVTDLEWLDECNYVLDYFIEAQQSGPLTTPDIISTLLDPVLGKDLHLAGLLATAIQRLSL
jgi:hypothetical protein